MIGAIIGAVAALGAGVANGIIGAKESARQASARRRMRNENRMWYDREYNAVGRERQSAQVVRDLLREHLADRVANSKGRSAVMGGTNALELAQRAEDNKLAAKVLGQLDAQQESRLDKLSAEFRQREAQLDNLDLQSSAQKQANLANAVSTASAVASQIGGAVDAAKSSSPKVDAAGESAASGGTTASKTGVFDTSDEYYQRKPWDQDYFGKGELGGSVHDQWYNPATMQYEPKRHSSRIKF